MSQEQQEYSTMQDKEAIEMMARCKNEIVSLRLERDSLRPKADAYDAITKILSLLPRQAVGFGEDLVWLLEKRIKEMQSATPKEKTEQAA